MGILMGGVIRDAVSHGPLPFANACVTQTLHCYGTDGNGVWNNLADGGAYAYSGVSVTFSAGGHYSKTLNLNTVAYYPEAFSTVAQATLATLFPDAIIATTADAAVLGLNAVSDGRHVLVPAAATGLAGQLTARGFTVVPIDVSELLKGGGSVKCCTLELRRPVPLAEQRVEVSA